MELYGKDKEKNLLITCINVEKEFLYMTKVGRYLEIQTTTGKSQALNSLNDYYNLLLPFGFEYASRNTIVNPNKIYLFDERTNTAFFDKEDETKRVKVTKRNNKIYPI